MATVPYMFDLDRFMVGRMKPPAVIGGGVGGVAASGVSHFTDMSGGGFVTVEYSNISLIDPYSGGQREWSRFSAKANARQAIIVPLLVDIMQPITMPHAYDAEAWSDGTLFTDGTGWSSLDVNGSVRDAVSAGASSCWVSVIGGDRDPSGGEWFGVCHDTKSYHAYNVLDVLDKTTVGGVTFYQVNFMPTWREASAAGLFVSWTRPKCLMHLPPNVTIDTDYESYWRGSSSVKFIERF